MSPIVQTRRLLLAAAAGMLGSLATGLPARARQDSSRHGGASPLTVALTGDSLITRRLTPYSERPFLALVELLRSSDATFTNLEMSLNDYEVYPMVQSGGQHLSAPPEMARELAWAGVRLASLANNHALDWGVEGMRLTRDHARKAGLIVAGVGDSLPEAREPVYLETPHGRVALVAVASTFTVEAPAGRTRGDMPARPGLNPLHFDVRRVVTPESLSALNAIATGGAKPDGHERSLRAFNETFVAGAAPAVETHPDPRDLSEITAAISNAARLSDLTIVSIHAHESEGQGHDIEASTEQPPAFLKAFARAAIDAGADVVVGHGPHILRGIELYKGKPIFYSLGNFIFQNETLRRIPEEDYELAEQYFKKELGSDAGVADFDDLRYDHDHRGFPARREFWESAAVVLKWRDRQAVEIALHPLTLGFGLPQTVRGRPMLAEGDAAEKILADLVRLSAPLQTPITVKNGVAIIGG